MDVSRPWIVGDSLTFVLAFAFALAVFDVAGTGKILDTDLSSGDADGITPGAPTSSLPVTSKRAAWKRATAARNSGWFCCLFCHSLSDISSDFSFFTEDVYTYKW